MNTTQLKNSFRKQRALIAMFLIVVIAAITLGTIWYIQSATGPLAPNAPASQPQAKDYRCSVAFELENECLALEPTTTAELAPGVQTTFRCGGLPGTTKYEFKYRTTPNGTYQNLSSSSSSVSGSLTLGTYLEVQCIPCAGEYCASAESVADECTYVFETETTPTPTPSVTPTPTPSPSTTPTPTPSTTPTPTPSGTPTPTPSVTPTPTPSVTPTPTPSVTPTPTATPPLSCNNTCSTSADCASGLSCIENRCRNSQCSSSTSCTCGSTPTPGVTPTPTTPVAQVTPSPVTALPTAGNSSVTLAILGLGAVALAYGAVYFSRKP